MKIQSAADSLVNNEMVSSTTTAIYCGTDTGQISSYPVTHLQKLLLAKAS